MSPSGVDDDEMPVPSSPDPVSNDPLDAVLGGRVAPGEDLDSLASFVEDVRAVASGPAPRPKAELAALMSGSLSPDPDPTAALARAGTERSWRSKRMSIRTALAKAGGLGLAAKIALGAGVAAASVTTAGAAGVLPDPAHDVVAEVISATTPFDLPEQAKVPDSVDLSSVPAPVLPDPDDLIGGGGVVVDDDVEVEVPDGQRTQNHGLCVSTAAKAAREAGLQGRARGQAVSEVAKSDCGKPETTGTPPTPTTTSTTTTTIDTNEINEVEEGDGPGRGQGGPNRQGPGNVAQNDNRGPQDQGVRSGPGGPGKKN